MPNNSWSTISSGSVTVSSREMNSFSSQDITYGNGKYLSVGNINLQGYMSGSGQSNDNGTINSFNYSNQSYSEWGYRVLSSTDNGNSWQSAKTFGQQSEYCWQLWKARVQVSAETRAIILRAFDTSGGFMPGRVPWNAKGYLQNSWYRLPIQVQ